MTTILFPPPDPRILARRNEIMTGLRGLVPSGCLMETGQEMRVFETDGLTAYRRMPLAVILPETTEQVSAVMTFCHAQRVRIVPRRAFLRRIHTGPSEYRAHFRR